MATERPRSGLSGLREPTTDAEQQLAIFAAEARLGRKLTAAEKRIDIVAIDRDLKNGKAELHAAIQAEQRRAIEEWTRTGHLILRVTDRMMTALGDLYDAGAEHAAHELEQAKAAA